jgi:hypothetical protein
MNPNKKFKTTSKLRVPASAPLFIHFYSEMQNLGLLCIADLFSVQKVLLGSFLRTRHNASRCLRPYAKLALQFRRDL